MYSRRKALACLIFTSLFIHTGCAAFIMTMMYKEGELTRLYPATPEETIQLCTETLAHFGIPVQEKLTGGITTRINGEWPDGTPVKIKLVMKTGHITQVSIRSGYVGVLKREEAELIHEQLTERLRYAWRAESGERFFPGRDDEPIQRAPSGPSSWPRAFPVPPWRDCRVFKTGRFPA